MVNSGIVRRLVILLSLLLTACSGPGLLSGQSSTTSSPAQANPTTSTTTVVTTPASTKNTVTTQEPAVTTTEIASTSAPHTATTAATATKSTALTAKVYFTRGTTLAVETVPVTAQQPLHDSLQALLSGPRQPGLYTQIPSGTKLLGVSVAQDVATINLSHPAATVQGSPAIPLMLAQIVDTATQFPSVHRVRLLIEGKPVTSLGGEGVPVPRYLDRTNVERMLQQE